MQKVEEIRASFDRGGYAPILLAQDMPTGVRVVEETVSGDTARARAETSFDWRSFLVEPTREADTQMIADVLPGARPLPAPADLRERPRMEPLSSSYQTGLQTGRERWQMLCRKRPSRLP